MNNAKEPEGKEIYQILLDNTVEMIILFDKSGTITDCNISAKEELGYDDDIILTPINGIFHDAFEYINNQIKVDNRFANRLHETTAYRKNQTCLSVNLKVVEDYRNGSYIGLCVAANVEDMKQASREIRELKRELSNSSRINSEMIAKVAHELRTPLNGIIGFINNLKDTVLTTNQLEAVDIINVCANNLSSLINELLDFSMLTSQMSSIEAKEFSFPGFIRNIEDNNIGSFNEKGLKYLHYIADDIPERLIGDEFRLTQILNNLFSNAVKFTPSGHISLEVIKLIQTEQDIELLFMINDTGIGIEQDKMGLLFQSFTQLDSSINRRYGGTGLGLMICKKYIEAMQGSINVDSRINKGSTFSFTVHLALPMLPEKMESGNIKSEKQEQDTVALSLNSDRDKMIFDYIDNELLNIKNSLNPYSENQEQEVTVDINDILECIVICIEMENWEKAEQLACRLKSLLPIYEKLISTEVLRLLLSIRREDRTVSLSVLHEIKHTVSKEE